MKFEDFFSAVRRKVNSTDEHDWSSDEIGRAMRTMSPRLAEMWAKGEDPSTGALFVVAELDVRE